MFYCTNYRRKPTTKNTRESLKRETMTSRGGKSNYVFLQLDPTRALSRQICRATTLLYHQQRIITAYKAFKAKTRETRGATSPGKLYAACTEAEAEAEAEESFERDGRGNCEPGNSREAESKRPRIKRETFG